MPGCRAANSGVHKNRVTPAVVVAWTVGREFTDGTVVGLFAIAASRGQIAQAKLLAYLCWASSLVLIARHRRCARRARTWTAR